MTLTKAEIVNSINGIVPSKAKASETVETMLEIMERTMEDGKDVLISGFGKFCVRDKQKRRGRNPATGDSMMLEPRRVVTFRCSQIVKG